METKVVFFTVKAGCQPCAPYIVVTDQDMAYRCVGAGGYQLYQAVAELDGAGPFYTVDSVMNAMPIALRELPIEPKGNWTDLTNLLSYLREELGEEFAVLKGGYMLASREISKRGTVDIDLDLFSREHYARVREVLRKYGEMCLARGQISDYSVVEEISDISGGAKYYLDGSVKFSIDVSDGASTHEYEYAVIPGIGNVLCETLESVVADKISVLFSIRRFRRVKDFYDLFFLSKNASLDLDNVRKTMLSSGHWPVDMREWPFTEDSISKLSHAWSKFTVKESALGAVTAKPTVEQLVESVEPLLKAVLDENEKHWS